MIHSNVICKACGKSFTYESRSKTPRAACSTKCRSRLRVLTPEQKAAKVRRVREWRAANPDLNRQKRKAFYDANAERLRADTQRWYAANAERARARHRAYHEANKDEINRRHRERWASDLEFAESIKALQREARKQNPELFRERDKERYTRRRDRVLAARRERYASDPEHRRRMLEATKKWREENPEAARIKGLRDRHARMARLREVEYEDLDPTEVFERDGWRCHICECRVAKHRKWPDPWSPSLDHVVPLSKGGGHTVDNVRLSHLHCNLAKGDRAIA